MIIAYFTNTGQTKRFVNKLGLRSHEISIQNPFIELHEPFILIAPSYEPEVTDHSVDFLETGDNLSYLKGVIGTGNRNFADLFCYTAKDIAVEYNSPYLYEIEFQGTSIDVDNVLKIVKEIEDGSEFLTPYEMGYKNKSKGRYLKGEVEISRRK